MAVYVYKAMTKTGIIVKNKVEAPTKQLLVTMLKNNDLLPISIDRVPYLQRGKHKKQNKNIDNREYMKDFNSTEYTRQNKNVFNANPKNY